MRLLSALGMILLASISTFGQDAQTSTSVNSNTNISASQSGAQAQTNNNVSSGTAAGVAGSKGKAGAGKDGAGTKTTQETSTSGQAGAKTPKSDIAPGTQIPIGLAKGIDAKKAKQGESVTARTTADVVSSGKVVIPRGSKVLGHVTQAKARSKGDSESSLGLVFDRVVLRGGQTVSLQTVIQAVAAPPHMEMPAEDSGMGAENSSSGNSTAGGGGMAGGLGGAVTNTAGAATSAAGGAVDAAGNVAGGVGNVDGNLGQPISAGMHGMIGAGTKGVVGLKDMQLNSAATAASSTSGSVLTTSGKDLRLDGGTQMVLVTGAGAGAR